MHVIGSALTVMLSKCTTVLVITLVSLRLLAGGAVAQPLPAEKVLPRELAVAAALGAIAVCEQQGYRVSAAVVDRSGLVRALIRGDGAAPHTLDSSRRKAYTSASFYRSTEALTKMVAADPVAGGRRQINEQILLLGGGLPIKAGDDIIGGIGVGGAPGGDKDESCAQAGLDKITPNLK